MSIVARIHCRNEDTPRKLFMASPIPPRKPALHLIVLITPSGKEWFVEVMPLAMVP